MTRIPSSALPTPSRAWRAVAALMFSLVLTPVAMADEPAAHNATPAAAVALRHPPPLAAKRRPNLPCLP
ncbi:hypothetical protein G3O07_20670 [Pseudomonas laurentiana]|uniref:Uncharacterized protein n=1 Tax=Pseudomonas laurentiana TaxID=2364649 RepID=A0A6I5RVD1_9PSED|nr:hypothetical protein [Pseudomonas laurentiana]